MTKQEEEKQLPTTWEEVAKFKKLHPVKSLPYPKPKDKEEEYLNECFIMPKVIEVINDDLHFPDHNDGTMKYEPIFDLSGVEFSYYFYVNAYACTFAGSRLAYKTLSGLLHGVKHFLPNYKRMYKK